MCRYNKNLPLSFFLLINTFSIQSDALAMQEAQESKVRKKSEIHSSANLERTHRCIFTPSIQSGSISSKTSFGLDSVALPQTAQSDRLRISESSPCDRKNRNILPQLGQHLDTYVDLEATMLTSDAPKDLGISSTKNI